MLDRPSLPISEIVQIAANSALARVSWDGGRGRAPLGLHQGHGRDVRGRAAQARAGRPGGSGNVQSREQRQPSRRARPLRLQVRGARHAQRRQRDRYIAAPVRADDRSRHARIVGPLLRRPRPLRQQHLRRQRRGRAVPDELGRARREPPDPAAARRVSGQRRRRLSRDLLRGCHAAPRRSRQLRIRHRPAVPAAVQGLPRFCGGDRGRRVAQPAHALGTHQPARGRA